MGPYFETHSHWVERRVPLAIRWLHPLPRRIRLRRLGAVPRLVKLLELGDPGVLLPLKQREYNFGAFC